MINLNSHLKKRSRGEGGYDDNDDDGARRDSG